MIMIILPCLKPPLHQWVEKLSFMSNNTQCSWKRRKCFSYSRRCLPSKHFPQTNLSLHSMSLKEELVRRPNYNYFHGDGQPQKARKSKNFDHASSTKVNYLSLTPFLIHRQKRPQRKAGPVSVYPLLLKM